MAAETPRRPREQRVLLASSRPAVRAFFAGLRAPGDVALRVGVVPVSADALPADAVARASVAAVDAAPDRAAAVELCRALASRRADLPIAVLVCCAHAVTPRDVQAFVAAGVTGWLDLAASPVETARLVHRVASGSGVLHVELAPGGLGDLLLERPGRGDLATRLLELVALGLSDRTIGEQLHLSPHTVKHHVEELRRKLCARNRAELAAWAGANGFYNPRRKS